MLAAVRQLAPAWLALEEPGRTGRSREAELEIDMDDVLSVNDPELLRAVPLRHVLAGFGRRLRDNKGSDKDFDLSEAIKKINVFLSHAWKTPGWLKYCTLLYKNNALLATAAALLVQAVVHGIELLHLVEVPHLYVERTFVPGGTGIRETYMRLHWMLAYAVFWLVFLWGHHLPFLPKRTCFLDKVCIHQTDPVKKQAGVQMLGAYLRHSDIMMVFWQPEYFQRTWCVFEMAAFLHMNRENARIDFVPLKLPTFAIALNVFHGVVSVGANVLMPYTLLSRWFAERLATLNGPLQVLCFFAASNVFLFLIYIIPAFPMWFFIRFHTNDRRALLHQLQDFSFKDTGCVSPDDHKFVRSRIERWFGSIAEFDEYVRQALTQTVFSSLVWHGPIPYRVVLFGCLSHLLIASTLALSAAHQGDAEMALRSVCMCISMFALADAIVIAVVLRLATSSWANAELPASSTGEKVARRLRWLAGPLATAALSSVMTSLSIVMIVLPLWVSAAVVAVEAILAWLLYRGRAAQEEKALRRSLTLHASEAEASNEGKSSNDEEQAEEALDADAKGWAQYHIELDLGLEDHFHVHIETNRGGKRPWTPAWRDADVEPEGIR